MNRTCNYNKYESNCQRIDIRNNEESSFLDSIGNFISKLTVAKSIVVIRVIFSLICFFGFIGVIGGVESGSLSLSTGIILSIFFIFIEILCFSQLKRN